MNTLPVPLFVLALLASSFIASCDTSRAQLQESHHEEQRKLVVTSPVAQDVVVTRTYVSQVHSRRHIEVRAIDSGYLQQIQVQEGQAVKQGAVMFKIVPVLYQAKLDTESADAELAQIRYDNTKILSAKAVVSDQEVAMAKAELTKAKAKVGLAQAEFNFTALKAPFDGIVDRQYQQHGSLVNEGDVLSTLSDNQVMWVYFNVPEAQYIEYKTNLEKQTLDIELKLANGEVFSSPGKIGAIEADFNNETGNIAFRADFPNPDNLLRHGQTGTILLHQKVHDALVIPQRATFELLANKYVFVIEPDARKGARPASQQTPGDGHKSVAEHGGAAAKAAAKPHGEHSAENGGHYGIVRQRQIFIKEELDDIYLIESGLKVTDKIVFEGILQVRDGDRVEYELLPAKEILSHLKYHAE